MLLGTIDTQGRQDFFLYIFYFKEGKPSEKRKKYLKEEEGEALSDRELGWVWWLRRSAGNLAEGRRFESPLRLTFLFENCYLWTLPRAMHNN